MAAVTTCSDFGAQKNSLSLFPHLFAVKWWNQMPWSSFLECWVLSQLFHPPLSLSSSSSSVPLHFLSQAWCHLHISDYRYTLMRWTIKRGSKCSLKLETQTSRGYPSPPPFLLLLHLLPPPSPLSLPLLFDSESPASLSLMWNLVTTLNPPGQSWIIFPP